MTKKFGKMLVLMFLLVILFLIFPNKVLAEIHSGSSAIIKINDEKTSQDLDLFDLQKKQLAIKSILSRYQSPLTDEVDSFLFACIRYNLDCYLLPAIAGLESTFGRYIYPNSYNPFGWGGGYIIFNSWEDGINTVSKGLRENYMDKWHLGTIEEIGRVYSESPTWAIRVNWFINEFKKEEEKLSLILSDIEVK